MTEVLQNLWNLTSTENLKGQLYILQNLSSEEKSQLLKELYSIGKELFSNYTYPVHLKLMNPPGAIKTYISVCSNANNEKVGFFTIQVYNTKINGKNFIIFRNQTGILRNYRRKIGNIYLLVLLFVYYRLRYPFTPMLSCLVIMNPTLYAKLGNLMFNYIPSPNYIESKRSKLIIRSLIQFFNLIIPSEKFPWSVYLGSNTEFSIEDLQYLEQNKDPKIQFFMDQNPKMRDGYGLLTIIHYSWINIILSSVKVLSYLIKRLRYQETDHK